jgi:hypothetical protein
MLWGSVPRHEGGGHAEEGTMRQLRDADPEAQGPKTESLRTMQHGLRPMTIMLIAQLVIHASAPPLAPQDAVTVLRGSKSIADRTGAYVVTPADAARPQVIVIRSKPGDGPFGSFPPQAFRPLGVHHVHGITFKVPHGGNDEGRRHLRP